MQFLLQTGFESGILLNCFITLWNRGLKNVKVNEMLWGHKYAINKAKNKAHNS